MNLYEHDSTFYRDTVLGLLAVAAGKRTFQQFYIWLNHVRVDGVDPSAHTQEILLAVARAAEKIHNPVSPQPVVPFFGRRKT